MFVVFALAGMLQYKHSVIVEQAPTDYLFGQFRCLLQIERRIGKDYVVFFLSFLNKLERIGQQRTDATPSAESPEHLGDKALMLAVEFDARDVVAAAREELIADAARPRKQVEHLDGFEVDDIVQDIEQAFLCIVGCGPRLETGRR